MSRPKAEGEFSLNEPREGKAQESLVIRLLWMVVIFVMLIIARTVLAFVTIIHFIIMLVSGRQPNEFWLILARLWGFGLPRPPAIKQLPAKCALGHGASWINLPSLPAHQSLQRSC